MLDLAWLHRRSARAATPERSPSTPEPVSTRSPATASAPSSLRRSGSPSPSGSRPRIGCRTGARSATRCGRSEVQRGSRTSHRQSKSPVRLLWGSRALPCCGPTLRESRREGRSCARNESAARSWGGSLPRSEKPSRVTCANATGPTRCGPISAAKRPVWCLASRFEGRGLVDQPREPRVGTEL